MIVDQKLTKGFVGVLLIDGCIDGTQLAVTNKPNLFRRLMIRLLLGWRWISVENKKKLETKKKEADLKKREIDNSK